MPTNPRRFRWLAGHFVVRLLSETIVRAGLALVPFGAGSALDVLTFGVADRVTEEKLRSQVKQLGSAVLELARQRQRVTASDISQLPASLSLSDLLSNLSHEEFESAARALLASLVDKDSPSSRPDQSAQLHEELRRAVHEARVHYELQIDWIRETHSRWVESKLTSQDAIAILDIASAIEQEAKLQLEYADRRVICLDTNVLHSFVKFGHGRGRFPDEVASHFLVKRLLDRRIAISEPHLQEFSRSLPWLIDSSRHRDVALTEPTRIRQLLHSKPIVWGNQGRNDKLRSAIYIDIMDRIREAQGFSHAADAAVVCDTNAIAMIWSHNSDEHSGDYVSLATESRSLLQLRLPVSRHNADFSRVLGCPIQSVYGVAWGCYRNSVSTPGILDAYEVASAIPQIMARVRDAITTKKRDAPLPGASTLQPILNRFSEIVSPFHGALVADLVELTSSLALFEDWLGQLVAGSLALQEVELKTIKLISELEEVANDTLGGLSTNTGEPFDPEQTDIVPPV